MSETVTLILIGITLLALALIHVAAYWYIPAVLQEAEPEDDHEGHAA